jgi:hypothetical protein
MVLLGAALASCSLNEVLDVPDPDVATPASLNDKSALPTLMAGAVGDMAGAYSGFGDDAQISLSGLFSDELHWAETFPTRQQVDARNIETVNGTMTGLFRNLERGRASASRAAAAYASLDPTNPLYGEALGLEAFAFNLKGENYCSGAPTSVLSPSGAAEYGDPETTTQIFERAVRLADSALAAIGTNTSTIALRAQNLAKVMKARALLNLNQTGPAKAALAGVPTTFSYELQHSENTGRQNNGLYALVYLGRRFSVSDREGGNGLPYRSDNDPRVQWALGTGALAFGFDGSTPLYLELKYPARSSNVVVANGIEARLIEAEADLRDGAVQTWLGTLNTIRGTVSGLGQLQDPGNTAARVDLHFKERAYWLWLTSHRLGDLRRLVRQYSRSAETVFPTGAFFKGGTYGGDVNFPVPFDETNNPKFVQCLDRNA